MSIERSGSVRAARPAAARSSVRTRVLLPAAAAAAVAGIALVAVAQGAGGTPVASEAQSLDELAAAGAQGYQSNLLGADGAPVGPDQGVAASRGGDSLGVTVTTPEPTQPAPAPGGGGSSGGATDVGSDPAALKAAAADMAAGYGWGADEFACLDKLWEKESGWNPLAENPSSGAYGIPQSYPAEKLATAGDDWRTNGVTQIKWGLQYISERHGSPCAAYNQHNGSY